MAQRLTEDARRLLRENLDQTWQKYVAVLGVILALLSVGGLVASDKLGLGAKLKFTAALLVVAGTTYLIYFLIYSLRRAYRLLPPDAPSHRHLVEVLATLFGLRKTSLEIECAIHKDGSSVSTYDIQLLAQADEITQIEYLSSTPSAPQGAAGMAIEYISSKPTGVTMKVEVLRRTHQECFWAVNFSPALKSNQTVEYRQVVRTTPGTFTTTAEEMEHRGLAYESYSMQVTYPTDRLRLRVSFGGGAKPSRITHDVWFGRGRVRHMSEYARITTEKAFRTDLDRDGKLFGELQLSYPIHGLRYVVRWVPENAQAPTETP